MAKQTKWYVRPAKTQISLCINPVWSESSLSAWRKLGSLVAHCAHSEGSDHTGRMPRLIWVFAGRTCHFVGFVVRRLKLSSSNHLICFSEFQSKGIWTMEHTVCLQPDQDRHNARVDRAGSVTRTPRPDMRPVCGTVTLRQRLRMLGLVLFEPSYEKNHIRIVRFNIIETRMRSHAVGSAMWLFVWSVLSFHILCARTEKTLVRLRGFTGSPGLSPLRQCNKYPFLWPSSYDKRNANMLSSPEPRLIGELIV